MDSELSSGGKAPPICNFQTKAAGSRYAAMDQPIPMNPTTSARLGSNIGARDGDSA
jgi:hypothetical protein